MEDGPAGQLLGPGRGTYVHPLTSAPGLMIHTAEDWL